DVSIDFPSSTVTTPSFPTRSIASAMRPPICASPLGPSRVPKGERTVDRGCSCAAGWIVETVHGEDSRQAVLRGVNALADAVNQGDKWQKWSYNWNFVSRVDSIVD